MRPYRARWFSYGAMTVMGSVALGLALGQRLFNRSIIYPNRGDTR